MTQQEESPGATVPSPFGTPSAPLVPHEEIAAAEIARHIAAGDEGAVLRAVHALEHDHGPWHVNPWRLIEAMGRQPIRAATQAAAKQRSSQCAGPDHG